MKIMREKNNNFTGDGIFIKGTIISATKTQAIAFARQEIKEWQKFIKKLSNKKK